MMNKFILLFFGQINYNLAKFPVPDLNNLVGRKHEGQTLEEVFAGGYVFADGELERLKTNYQFSQKIAGKVFIYYNFARKRLLDLNPTFRFIISFSRIEFFALKIF